VSVTDELEAYRKKADQIQESMASQKSQTLNWLRDLYDFNNLKGRESSTKNWQRLQASVDQAQKRPSPIHARIEVTDEAQFKELDQYFFDAFNLNKYFPKDSFSYPVIYCESLEEFYEAWLSDQKLSRKEKQKWIKSLVEECESNLARGGGVIQGVDVSGVGCYLNGWLFGKKYNIHPKVALKIPEIAEEIAEVAIHEKIGHGFLSMFSALGQAINALGTRNVKEAEQYGLEVSTDPLHKLRQKQYDALLWSSIFQQEGWATWIESYFAAFFYQIRSHPKYQFGQLRDAINAIKTGNDEEKSLKQSLRAAFEALFDDNLYPPEGLLLILDVFKQAEAQLFDQLTKLLGQPLRYVVGQLLMYRVEMNAGVQCVPHASLLAGNIKLDVKDVGLQDLKVLLSTDPISNTDTRLAMISKIKLKNLNDVVELARRCEEDLSMPVPAIYKQPM